MPIYLYRCDQCRESHEALQRVSEGLLKVCPHCGEEALRKLIAPAGVIFKGSGFHKNDYSSTGRRSAGSSSTTSTSSSPASSKPAESSAPAKSAGAESKVA